MTRCHLIRDSRLIGYNTKGVGIYKILGFIHHGVSNIREKGDIRDLYNRVSVSMDERVSGGETIKFM